MAIPVYLQQFKAAGIYRVVFDKSTVLNQDSSILRMVVGYSDKGPFNIPTYIRSVGDFKALYGDISKTLEKRGDFFHRTAIQMLAAGPILCLNLKKFENEVVGGTQIDTTFNTAYALNSVEIPVEDVYDTTSFWELSAEKLNDVRGAEYINIATTNTKATSGTYFIRKASGNKVAGWNVTVRDWYADAHEDVPEYLLGKENQKMSAFMAEIYVFNGRFTADQVLASSSLKKYFEVNLDGKLVLKQYITNAFGDSVDTLDALYMDETSGAIGHYIGSLIPGLRDKNGVYAALDILFNQDQTVHNMMMSFNTDMLEEEGTAQIDLSGAYNISTHDTGNQHDQGHKFAAANVPYGAKPLCLDDMFDGIAVSNLLGNSNSPIVSDVVEFRTSVYADNDLVKYPLKYQNAKKVSGALYVSHISGSNITLSHVGNNGNDNITVDCAAADDVNYILYQLGAAYEYKHPNDDHTAIVTEYIPYESGLGTYFEGVNAYDMPNNLQGPKKIITSISRDIKTDDDIILLGGNKVKCSVEDVYITTKSQYKNTLIGDSVKIVSDEEYQKMLDEAGYGSRAKLNAAQYISWNRYQTLTEKDIPAKSQYRVYSEIVAYQKYDYVTLPKVAEEDDETVTVTSFKWDTKEITVKDPKTGADVTKEVNYVTVDTETTLKKDDVYVQIEDVATGNLYTVLCKVEGSKVSFTDYNGVTWHEVGDIYGEVDKEVEYVNSINGEVAETTVSCPAHLYWHAVIPCKKFDDMFQAAKAAGEQTTGDADEANDYAGYAILLHNPALTDNYAIEDADVQPLGGVSRWYESLSYKCGWKPVYDETKWYLITDAELLGYAPHKWINKITVEQWKALKEVAPAKANNYRAGFDIVAYQKYDYVCHWSTKNGQELNGGASGEDNMYVDLSFTDTSLQMIPVDGETKTFVGPQGTDIEGIEFHLVIDERCKKLLYAHTIQSIEVVDSLTDKTGWKAIYQVTYYYRIITANAYDKLPKFGTGITEEVEAGTADIVIGQLPGKIVDDETVSEGDHFNQTIAGVESDDDIFNGVVDGHLKDCLDPYSSWSVYQWINGNILTNESWNVYGSAVTFVGVDTTVWSLESDVSMDADTDLYTYTFKASATDDQSVLTFFQKGDCIVAEDATTDSDGDGEYEDEVENGLYDLCYVQETGTDFDENGVPTTYWVKFTGKPAIYLRDGVNYVVVINSALNQEIGTMEPQYLKGYTYEHSKPEGTGMMAKLNWQKYMLSALTDYKGLRKGLMSKAEIQYRYVVDGFESYVQSGLKNELAFLCKEKQNAFAIANFPSVRTFVKCPYTSFVDDKGIFNVEYVVKGYNKKKAAVTRFDLPSADEGASFIAFYTPLKFSDGYIDSMVPSAGLVSNLFMEKYMSRQPYYIVAGPNYASISASGLVGPDYHYSDDELNLIEPFGVNCMVYRPGFGTFVNANQTAKQTPVSALSKVHIRELVIFLQDEVAKILQAYQWEFNNQVVRNKIKDRADYICNQIKANGGLIDFINIMDESNNTPEIIDNEMAILSTHIEPGRGMGKMIHELTLYKTGEMRSMIAGE